MKNTSKPPDQKHDYKPTVTSQYFENKENQNINQKRCYICYQNFTTSEYPLSVQSHKKLSNGSLVCIGCKNLFGKHVNDKKVDIVKSYLRNPNQDISNTSKLTPIKRLNECFKKTRTRMIERCVLCNEVQMKCREKAREYCKTVVPSSDELKDIALKSKDTCSISGIRGTWKSSTSSHWRRLVFDHVIPISKGGSFKGDNLQLTLTSFNQLKGSNDQSEVTRFLVGFKNNKDLK